MSTQIRRHDNTTTRPTAADLDPRVTFGHRNDLLPVIVEHDVTDGRCIRCGWTGRACPSRVLARAVRDRKAVPGWLVHLVDVVPGAIAPAPQLSDDERRAIEDQAPGLFEALPRQTGRGAT